MYNYIPQIIWHSIFYAGILTWESFHHYDTNTTSERVKKQYKYKPLIYGNRVPFMILFIMFVFLALNAFSLESLIPFCLIYCPIVSAYYILLFLVLSYLRKHYQHRNIIILWLLPAILSLDFLIFNEAIPFFIISISKKLTKIILLIWFVGFIGVLVWHCITHLLYRRKILSTTQEIKEESILEIWNNELYLAHKDYSSFHLVKSSFLSSPLTIGMFDATTYVILPNQNYNKEELTLIFRHEILHIYRKDVGTKFFLIFCNALCWYNPLMWAGMKKCSEDIELSCDEAVLEEETHETRNLYAHTLLNHAQSTIGFTSCLSSSASSLKYRIQNILKPVYRKNAAALIGISFFVLNLLANSIVFAYEPQNGLDVIYQNENSSLYKEVSIQKSTEFSWFYDSTSYNIEKFNTYMKTLEFQELNRNCFFLKKDPIYTIKINKEDKTIYLTVSKHFMKVAYDQNLHLYTNDVKYYYSKKEIRLEDLQKYVE